MSRCSASFTGCSSGSLMPPKPAPSRAAPRRSSARVAPADVEVMPSSPHRSRHDVDERFTTAERRGRELPEPSTPERQICAGCARQTERPVPCVSRCGCVRPVPRTTLCCACEDHTVDSATGATAGMRDATPKYQAPQFTCPSCDAITGQTWQETALVHPNTPGGALGVHTAVCQACSGVTIWVGGVASFSGGATPLASSVILTDARLVEPPPRSGPPPSRDLPPDALRDYNEARTIVDMSPRGAAALLRLCLQRLLAELGYDGVALDDAIATLVREHRLRAEIQQSMDVLRVVGNNAVHPGELDLRDDKDTTLALFDLINLVVDQLISQPRRVAELYARLPAGARQAIDRRDGSSPAR
jgi:hypothetical protein